MQPNTSAQVETQTYSNTLPVILLITKTLLETLTLSLILILIVTRGQRKEEYRISIRSISIPLKEYRISI